MNQLYLFDEKGRASVYGIGTYIQSVISACAVSDFNITVVTLRSYVEATTMTTNNGVRYIDIPLLLDYAGKELDLEQKENRKRYCQYVVSELEQYVSSADSHIFHLNYTQDYFLAECLKGKWMESKIILTIHYFTWCFALQSNITRLSSIISKNVNDLSDFEKEVIYSGQFEQQLFKLADEIICLSHFAKQILIDYYEIPTCKLWLINNGLTDYHTGMDKMQLREKYGIPGNEKMILFVGRLDHIKGLQYLIEAFKEIVASTQSVHLYIIGDGSFKEYLPLCYPIWKRITFCGRLLPEQVAEFYEMSDIGVLPSMHEQCSYVAIEMMMHSLPIIGTDSLGLDEMIIDGLNGYKVHLQEKNDCVSFPIEELVAFLYNFIQLPSLDKYAKQSRMLYSQRYTNESMKQNINQLYTFCIKGKKSPFYKMPN